MRARILYRSRRPSFEVVVSSSRRWWWYSSKPTPAEHHHQLHPNPPQPQSQVRRHLSPKDHLPLLSRHSWLSSAECDGV